MIYSLKRSVLIWFLILVHVLLPRTWSLFNSLVGHVLVWEPLVIGNRWVPPTPPPPLPTLIHGNKNELLQVTCSTKTLHVCVTDSGRVKSLVFVTGHKRAQDPPGSLHAIVSSVEWSSLKGRGPRWITVRKTTFTKTPHTYMSVLPTASGSVSSLVIGNGRKQAQDPPGSLHTIVSSVEWSSLTGRGLRWFIVRKTTFTKTPHTYMSVLPTTSESVSSLVIGNGRKQAQDPPGSLHTIVSSVEWSSLKGRGPWWFTVRKTTCFTEMPHTYMSVSSTASGRVN